ncbi:MAG: ATP-dependent 6-phosphofructokinase, partial [Clostridia bacterium]|nr:ATP-dependent 6-phosphofructokinase [Clostridia bacterium]
GDMIELDARSVDGLNTRGGTMLYTARCEEFKTAEGVAKAAAVCKYRDIDGIIAIGGDGTFRGIGELAKAGINVIGIPATIDNDIACTNYTIGFDTACNTAIESIDRLRDTMQSHERCSVVEVMGNNSGNLAVFVGIACGATATVIPEKKIDMEKEVFSVMRQSRLRGRNHHIIIVAEGTANAADVAKQIEKATGVDTRVTVLGHVQRGGTPSARDRVMASMMGVHAVNLLCDGKTKRVVCERDGDITDLGIDEALSMKYELNEKMYDVEKSLLV